MRAKHFLRESAGATLYHCTLTKNVAKIKSKGILPLQTSNWVQAGTGERYGGGYIFAFEHLIDAARWAAKWDWEISHKMGSGQVSVISFTDDVNDWETDDADPLGQASARGRWMKKQGHVPPQNIKAVEPATMDLIKQAVHESIIPSAKSVLFEYSRQITAQNLGDKIIAVAKRDPSVLATAQFVPGADLDMRLDWFMEGLEEIDPTPHKEYVQWLCKIYAGGQVKLEDLESRGKDALERFNKLKIKKQLIPAHRDINAYKTFQQFEDTVSSYPEVEMQVDKGNATEIYSDAALRVIQPLDEAAAKYYGQGTKWCTAAKNNNMFTRYAKMGPLYIILLTTPAYEGEKYQFHFESGQFMNEQDHEISLVVWPMLTGKYPQLVKVFAQKANLNLCIPLMPAKDKLIHNWEPMMDEVCGNISMNFPVDLIMRKLKTGLRGAMVTGEGATQRVLNACRFQLEDDEYGLMDIFARSIAPANISSRDELFGEIMMDPISDWIQEGPIGEIISELADDSDGRKPTIDDMGAYMEIVDAIFEVIYFKIKNAICEHAKQYG